MPASRDIRQLFMPTKHQNVYLCLAVYDAEAPGKQIDVCIKASRGVNTVRPAPKEEVVVELGETSVEEKARVSDCEAKKALTSNRERTLSRCLRGPYALWH